MRILELPAYFYPEKMSSSHMDDSLHEALAKAGIEMVIFCPAPTRSITPEIRKEYKKKKLEKMYDGKAAVHRFSLYKEGKNPVLRALRYFVACIMQFNRAVFSKDARRCNLLFITSTPPIKGAMAGLAKKFNHKPIVYNLQDIFPDSLVGSGLAKKGGFLWKIGRKIEDYSYRNADKIIVISEDFKKNILAKGVPEEKIVVIYNWVDEEAVKDVPRVENKLFDKYSLDRNKFYITYSGNIGLTQNMDLLLCVMAELKTEAPDIILVLVGEGMYKAQVERIVVEKGLTNVIMIPFQPFEDISHVFSLGDAGLVISKPGVGANSVPSKTWSIMSASRPVLANFDKNELKEIITYHRCGIFTEAGDKEAFKASILELYHHPELCKEYGSNGRQFVMDYLTKEVGTQKYVDVIKSFEK